MAKSRTRKPAFNAPPPAPPPPDAGWVYRSDAETADRPPPRAAVTTEAPRHDLRAPTALDLLTFPLSLILIATLVPVGWLDRTCRRVL